MMTLMLSVLDEVVDGMSISLAGVRSSCETPPLCAFYNTLAENTPEEPFPRDRPQWVKHACIMNWVLIWDTAANCSVYMPVAD